MFQSWSLWPRAFNLFFKRSMILSAYQPYFAPFSAFFCKAMRSDTLVLMDSVQFPQGTTWLARNRFKNDQGTLWMTIPVWKKGLGLQRINEVRICHEGRWGRKHLESLKTAYARAPFFEEHLGFIEETFKRGFEKLIDLNLSIIEHMLNMFRITAEIRLLSDSGIEEKEPELSLNLCKRLGASVFLAQSSAKKYLPEEQFSKQGITLLFFTPRPPVYPQLWGSFLPNLSALDLLFNCGQGAQKVLQRMCK